MADVVTMNPDDVKNILAPEVDPAVNVLETEEERLVAAKILPKLSAKIAAEADLRANKRIDGFIAQLKADNAKAIEQTIEQIKKDAKPLEPGDVEKLLSQDYLTITVKVPTREKGKTKQLEFVLSEQPQAVEQRFLKILKEKLVPYMKLLTSVDFKNATDMSSKLQTVIDVVPEALDLMSELVAIALNPHNESEYAFVTPEWVKNHMSSYRQFNVIMGQVSVSRIRDFFSAAYQGFPA